MSASNALNRVLVLAGLVASVSNALYAQTPDPMKKTETNTASVSNSPTAGQTMAKVNGVTLPLAHAELLLREQVAQGVANTPQLQTAVRETLITQAVLVQEARKQGLEQQPLVAAQMELARDNVLAQAWQQSFLQSLKIEETQLKAEYDRQIQILGNTEYLIRHALVADEATARSLLEKIQGGARLADLVQEYSADAQTKDRNGLSDWTPVGQLAPTIRDALQGLSKTQVVPRPVQTPMGWHVLQLEDQRAFQAPAIDQVRPQLVQAIVQQRLQQKITELRQSAVVE